MKKLRNFLSCTTIILIIVATIATLPMNGKSDDVCVTYIIQQDSNSKDSTNIESTTTLTAKDSIRIELTKAVHKYICTKSPTMADKLTDHMVDIALSYDFDLCFMMAQAQLETTFGRYGSGQSRKSIFGVNGRFSTYRECIEKYVKLVQGSYLGSKRTINNLLQNYVTVNGHYRYAGDKNYESELKHVYNQILAKTNIKHLQQQIADL